jgi:glycosyltransferase involved in cell wall biosynthesis
MAYRLTEMELSRPITPIVLNELEDGVGLVARFKDRLVGFALRPARRGAVLAAELTALADDRFAAAVLKATAEDEIAARWPEPEPPTSPTLTVAICTKDRAQRLRRLLQSLEALDRPAGFAGVEVLVVDNAPSDEATHEAVAAFRGVRYVLEPKAGLNFARNAALQAATGDLLAFLDDDVVVDRGWLGGLHRAWRGCPGAGGFTGLVLPYRLDTEAQVHFETHGGFGRGFEPTDFRNERLGNVLHPVGAGILGAGCNMCFDRRLLLELGGFDEALDTGAPLPGGGDLDIFYRVLRAGRTMVYDPRYAVRHEHRETLPQLKRQYWTWGLGFMAYLTKCRRADPQLRARHRGIVWWWLVDRASAVLAAALRLRGRELVFAWAELSGGLQGMAGEYDRSAARSRRIREQAV